MASPTRRFGWEILASSFRVSRRLLCFRLDPELSCGVRALSSAKYSAQQNLYQATVSASFQGDGCSLTHSSAMGAEENLLITNVSVRGSGCGTADLVLATGGAFHTQNGLPPEGQGGKPPYAAPLPAASGVAGSIPWVSRDSVTAVENSITAATCFTAGQHNDS